MKLKLSIIIFYICISNIFSEEMKFEGVNLLVQNDFRIGKVVYNQSNDGLFFTKIESSKNNNFSDKIYYYDMKKDEISIFFDSAQKSNIKKYSIRINNIFIFSNKLIVIVSELNNDVDLYKRYDIRIKDGSILSIEPLTINQRRLYDQQSISNRNIISDHRSKAIYKLNLENNSVKSYKYSDGIDFKLGPITSSVLSHKEDDIFVLFNKKDNMTIGFYSLTKKLLKKEIPISKSIIDMILLNSFTKIMISPNGKNILLNHFVYGLWICNIDSGITRNLFYIDRRTPNSDIVLQNWSNSENEVIVTKGNDIYKLDLFLLLKKYPDGIKIKSNN